MLRVHQIRRLGPCAAVAVVASALFGALLNFGLSCRFGGEVSRAFGGTAC